MIWVSVGVQPKHDISEAGGLMPDIPCSDYPHPGVPSGENDRFDPPPSPSLPRPVALPAPFTNLNIPTLHGGTFAA